jgi:hypothetical protein
VSPLTLSDWFGVATLLLLLLSFIQRQKLVNKDDLQLLREDLQSLRESATDTLNEARKTNGRITAIETWKGYHETWKTEQLEALGKRIDVLADVPSPKPSRRRK